MKADDEARAMQSAMEQAHRANALSQQATCAMFQIAEQARMANARFAVLAGDMGRPLRDIARVGESVRASMLQLQQLSSGISDFDPKLIRVFAGFKPPALDAITVATKAFQTNLQTITNTQRSFALVAEAMSRSTAMFVRNAMLGIPRSAAWEVPKPARRYVTDPRRSGLAIVKVSSRREYIAELLGHFSPAWREAWLGFCEALQDRDPDFARHAAISARELLKVVPNFLVSDIEAKSVRQSCEKQGLHHRYLFLASINRTAPSDMERLYAQHVHEAIDFLNGIIHGRENGPIEPCLLESMIWHKVTPAIECLIRELKRRL